MPVADYDTYIQKQKIVEEIKVAFTANQTREEFLEAVQHRKQALIDGIAQMNPDDFENLHEYEQALFQMLNDKTAMDKNPYIKRKHDNAEQPVAKVNEPNTSYHVQSPARSKANKLKNCKTP